MIGSVANALSTTLSKGVAKAAAKASWLQAPRKAGEAIATLLTTDNADYLRGALVLGSSIRSFDSSRDMVCLVTKAVPAEWRGALSVAGWTVREVDEVREFWWDKSSECSKFDADQAERWGHMATKLRLWQLTQYERIMYLDADTVLTGARAPRPSSLSSGGGTLPSPLPCTFPPRPDLTARSPPRRPGPVSSIFESVKGFAAEAPRHHAYFNAGVLLLSPSQVVFDELMAMGAGEHVNRFGNVVDCTEQGLLNSYYNGDAGREVTKLPVGRADVAADWASEAAPFAVHWITHVCPKPWLVADEAEGVPSHCDPVVYSYWERIWERLAASTNSVGSHAAVGSREAARRKMRRLTGVAAGSSMVGRRNWRKYDSVGAFLGDVRDSIGRELRELSDRRELRRRRWRDAEYDRPWSEGTWAWIAIVGTLALGLGAGALLHKLFIKPPDQVNKGMTVVQAKRMGFQALGEGQGPVGVVSAVDDDDDDDDEEEPAPKK